MKWEPITSRENKLLRHISRLISDTKYRRANGEYVCEGEKLLREALRDGVAVRAVLWEQQSLYEAQLRDPELFAILDLQNCRYVTAPANVFGAVSALETFSGPLFVCSMKEWTFLKGGRSFIALDRLQDPGNVGTVIRTADAFSVDGVWLLEGTADPYQPKAVRAAMGSIFRVPVYRVSVDEFFKKMRAFDVAVYAAALTEDAESIRAVCLDRCAVIIGNEGRGVRPECMKRCDRHIILPMTGHAESLNAAVAAAIVMWEMSGCR